MSETDQPDNYPFQKGGEEKQVRYVPVEYLDMTGRDENEISLFDLIKMVWDGRRVVIASLVVFTVIGIFFYLFGPQEYKSESILIQEQQQSLSQAQRLAQQFGGFGGQNIQQEGVIPPSLYPSILESPDFLIGVVMHEVEFETEGMRMSPLVYFNEYYSLPLTESTVDFVINFTIKLPVTLYRGVRSLFSGQSDTGPVYSDQQELKESRFINLNRYERFAMNKLKQRISLVQNGNLVTFSVSMPDANASAELNEFIVNRMQEYVIDYRIEKYRQNLNYVEKQQEEARERYEDAQLELAVFRDQNVNINTAVARTKQEELQNRRNVMFNVYNTLLQEVEQARIRLQEETPVFNVLQRPSLPFRSEQRGPLLLILSVFMGIFIGVFAVFIKNIWISVSSRIKQ